jgi:hypothetical protein
MLIRHNPLRPKPLQTVTIHSRGSISFSRYCGREDARRSLAGRSLRINAQTYSQPTKSTWGHTIFPPTKLPKNFCRNPGETGLSQTPWGEDKSYRHEVRCQRTRLTIFLQIPHISRRSANPASQPSTPAFWAPSSSSLANRGRGRRVGINIKSAIFVVRLVRFPAGASRRFGSLLRMLPDRHL